MDIGHYFVIGIQEHANTISLFKEADRLGVRANGSRGSIRGNDGLRHGFHTLRVAGVRKGA